MNSIRLTCTDMNLFYFAAFLEKKSCRQEIEKNEALFTTTFPTSYSIKLAFLIYRRTYTSEPYHTRHSQYIFMRFLSTENKR